MHYPSIIYWKWDDEHIDTQKYIAGIEDLTSRSCFDTIFICTHWCKNGMLSAETHDAIKHACQLLSDKGKRVILEIDARSEKAVFCKDHPQSRTGITYWKEIAVRDIQDGTVAFPIEKGRGADLFAGDRQSGEELLGIFRYVRKEDGYVADSLLDITAQCALTRTSDQTVAVHLPEELPVDHTIFVAVASWYDANDLSSDENDAFNMALFEQYKDIGLFGAAVDELSFMMSPFFGFSPATYQVWNDHPYYTHQLARKYAQKFQRDYKQDILNRFVGQSGSPEERTISINNYHAFIRSVVTAAEEKFYQNTKKYFGKDAFVGVHPTWFAIEEIDNTPEIWKNGIDWWEVPRDYGFTDEIMIYPVRLALTHKANANVFYNMWYGEGDGQLKSFVTEIYKNARFGGRTISLSYECKYETQVQQLCNPGELETVSGCEERISVLDYVQNSPAASDVLVVMGIPATCNEVYNQNHFGRWNTNDSVFKKVFRLAKGIWDAGYNCDLVGSYEIDNQALSYNENGKVYYGNQEYRFVIYAYPQFATEEELRFLEQLSEKAVPHMIIGAADADFSGKNCKHRFEKIQNKAVFYHDNPDISDILAIFQKYQVSSNRVECGCVLQDGSVILTHPAPAKAFGNSFTSEFTLHGRKIMISADDVAYVKLAEDGSLLRVESPALKELHLDGTAIVQNQTPEKCSMEALTIAFLGDSVTQGCFESFSSPEEEWKGVDAEAVYHNRLRKKLEKAYPQRLFRIINAGIAGNNSSNGLARVETDVLKHNPDMTVVCFGLNDVHDGEKNLPVYRDNLRTIFEKLHNAGSKAMFLTPNCMCMELTDDYADDKQLAHAQELCLLAQKSGLMDRYIETAKDVCREMHVPVCDCYGTWMQWHKEGRNVTNLLANHINHPSREMHQVFADALYESLHQEGLLG